LPGWCPKGSRGTAREETMGGRHPPTTMRTLGRESSQTHMWLVKPSEVGSQGDTETEDNSGSASLSKRIGNYARTQRK
jgi:hypothetical protein